MNLEELEKEIFAIKQRNRKVEEDKQWETSLTRKVLIAVLTYGVIVLFFLSANISNPFVNALTPTAGFVLSTLSFPWIKKVWTKYVRAKK